MGSWPREKQKEYMIHWLIWQTSIRNLEQVVIVYLSLTGSQNKQSCLEMNREELNERMLQRLKDGVDLKASLALPYPGVH